MQARVDDIQTLREVRRALWKFAEAATTALQEAYAEMSHLQTWLETEQTIHWQHQIRKRQQKVKEAVEALNAKKRYQPKNARISIVEEQKALAIAKERLAEAEAKLEATRRYARVLSKEMLEYKGAVQGFTGSLEAGIPSAVGQIDNMVATLEAYVASTPEEARSTAGSADGVASMALPQRAEDAPAEASEPEIPHAEGGKDGSQAG